MQSSFFNRLIITSFLALTALNLFILDLQVFRAKPPMRVSEVSITATPFLKSKNPANKTETPSNNICPQSCLSLIYEATSSLNIFPSIIKKTATSKTPPASETKEYYIPLGSGKTTKSAWEDITATETIINPENYGKIKEVYFIASLRNPTKNGQVEARLYNLTDKHPVWGSHIVVNGLSSQTISNKITLSAGAKLYRVQLKNTMSYQSFLDNAKVRIVTD